METIEKAREREKYWKSSIGRKKLKSYFIKIKNKKNNHLVPSSSG